MTHITGNSEEVTMCSTFADDEEWFTEEARCGWIPLGIAAKDNDVREMRKILKADKERRSLNMGNDFGWTPLFIAVVWGSTNAVKFLLKNGANPNVATSGWCSDGGACETPLSRAMAGKNQKYRDIVALLTAKGAKVAPKSLRDEYEGKVQRNCEMAAALNKEIPNQAKV
jgi:hypothetical protein